MLLNLPQAPKGLRTGKTSRKRWNTHSCNLQVNQSYYFQFQLDKPFSLLDQKLDRILKKNILMIVVGFPSDGECYIYTNSIIRLCET